MLFENIGGLDSQGAIHIHIKIRVFGKHIFFFDPPEKIQHLLCSADHIEATDASAAMIAQAKRGNFSSKLYFSVQDMFHLPYADQSFDVVIASNALHIVPHPEKALIELRRVLKNDGTLIAPTFTHAENSRWGKLQALALKIAGFPLHSRWTSAAYLAFLQQNGWTVCKSVVLQNSIPLTYAECKKSKGE